MFFRHWEAGPDQLQAQAEVRESVSRLVGRLPARLCQVIVAYYGLDEQEPQVDREIGARMEVTPQRVQQLRMQALVWMRHPAHSQALRELLQRHSQQEYEWAEEIAQAWLRHRGGRRGSRR